MRLKRIEAATAAEAMRRARQELGDEAVILHTKELPADRAGKGPRVEILAAVDEAIELSLAGRGPAPATRAEVAAPRVPIVAAASEAPAAGRQAEIAARLARFRAAVPTVPLTAAAPKAAPGRTGRIAVTPPEWTRAGGRARRVAFVGPTGAGKTTTLAKVAARAQLDHGCRVRLVTLDTYRIGAVPQLESYAQILGVPLDVADTPEAAAAAVEAARDADLVFIDTTGRSPMGGAVDSLVPFMEACRADEVNLVMSTSTRISDSLRAAASYARLGPDRLCFTKIDETDYHQALRAVTESTGLPLAWLGVGQSVPDDLEAAEPDRVAELCAGEEAR